MPTDAAPKPGYELRHDGVKEFPPFQYAHLLKPPEGGFGDWRDQLASDGYAVVKGLLSKEETGRARQAAFRHLEERGYGFCYADPSTYEAKNLPPHIAGGMYFNSGIAHENWVWDVRAHPAVVATFAKLWGTEELLTSFDSVGVFLPNRLDYRHTPSWEHIDQSPARRGFYVCQGLVNLNECGPEDGGLMALKGSSQLMELYFNEHDRTETRSWGPLDSYSFEAGEDEWFKERGCEWVKVNAEAGDLILWDSRTMHYSCLPQGDRDRTCVYVCQAPRHLATDTDLATLKEAFEGCRRTTHVTFGGQVWSKITQADVRPETGLPDPKTLLPPISPRPPTERILKLAGVMAY